jgi:hypothetical protein
MPNTAAQHWGHDVQGHDQKEHGGAIATIQAGCLQHDPLADRSGNVSFPSNSCP